MAEKENLQLQDKHSPSTLKIIQELGKVRISLPVALSALTGYALCNHTFGWEAFFLFWGVFLMSCCSGTLNHWQEYKTDALMPRTKDRPIPSGKISPRYALLTAIGYFIVGGTILLTCLPVAAFVTSVVTLLAYNAFYTPLKKVTAFAVIPGSLVGALPPYIGWLAAGGSILNVDIFFVALFFFLGQIPHFWLLLLMFGKEYKLAGYPSLNDILSDNQIKRLSFTWILATISGALVILLTIIVSKTIAIILLLYTFYLLFSTSSAIFFRHDIKVRPTFFKLNFLYLFMMIALIIDGLTRS